MPHCCLQWWRAPGSAIWEGLSLSSLIGDLCSPVTQCGIPGLWSYTSRCLTDCTGNEANLWTSVSQPSRKVTPFSPEWRTKYKTLFYFSCCLRHCLTLASFQKCSSFWSSVVVKWIISVAQVLPLPRRREEPDCEGSLLSCPVLCLPQFHALGCSDTRVCGASSRPGWNAQRACARTTHIDHREWESERERERRCAATIHCPCCGYVCGGSATVRRKKYVF